jgi:hypothetical protein
MLIDEEQVKVAYECIRKKTFKRTTIINTYNVRQLDK